MRALWKGTIGFGLVTIPVRLFSATAESELDFDLLDAKDHARIRFRRVNEDTGKEVPWERIVRAFEFNGRYVPLEDEDLKSAAAEKTDVITIHDFVQEEEVEGKYFEKPYYLEPEKGGARAYALLREALRKSGKVGIASFVLRTKEHPAVLQPDGPVLILNQLRFAEEIRPVSDLKLPKVEKLAAAELKLAMQLIDQGAGTFDITRYTDEYTSALMKVIRAKAKGKGPKPTAMKVVHAKPTEDLMSMLKASLGPRTARRTAGEKTSSVRGRKRAHSAPARARHRKAS
ncbi:MAG TPA: Ku protein [Flavobacteriales bacterium]|nr:Ku protein [Flavobacteriales bacterium]